MAGNESGLLGGPGAQYEQRPLGLEDIFQDTPLLRVLTTLLSAPGNAVYENTVGPLSKIFGPYAGAGMADAASNTIPGLMGVPEESYFNRVARSYGFPDAAAARAYENTPSARIERVLPRFRYNAADPAAHLSTEARTPRTSAGPHVEYEPGLDDYHQEVMNRVIGRSAAQHPKLFNSLNSVRVGFPSKPGTLAEVSSYWNPTQGITETPHGFVATPDYGNITKGGMGFHDLNISARLLAPGAMDRFFLGGEKFGNLFPGWENLSPEEFAQSALEHELHHAAQDLMNNRGLSLLSENPMGDMEKTAYGRQYSLIRQLIEEATKPDQIPPDIRAGLMPKGMLNIPALLGRR